MPADFSIAFEVGNGAWKPGVERGPRRQSMRGFEDTYVDIVDYIVRITHRIWEDQDIGYIYDTYVTELPGLRRRRAAPRHRADGGRHDPADQRLPRHAPLRRRGDLGRQRRAGLRHVAPCPQHRSPHRALALGAADGAQGQHAGSSPTAWSATTRSSRSGCSTTSPPSSPSSASTSPRRHGPTATPAPCARSPSASSPRSSGSRAARSRSRTPRQRGDGFDVDHFVRALLHDTYNRRDLSAVDRAYAQNVRWYGTTNRSGYGRSDVKAMARSLLSTFPDLGVHVDEVYWMGNERDGFRVSVRWTALGTHRGWSLYGEPTGRRVHLWALQQLYIHGGAIVEDWMLFNEFDVLAQLLKDDPEPSASADLRRPMTVVSCRQLAPSRSATRRSTAELTIAAGCGRPRMRGRRIIVLPELATAGYVFAAREEVADAALAVRRRAVRRLVRRRRGRPAAVVIGGFAERGRRRDGVQQRRRRRRQRRASAIYRKTHLWDREQEWFAAGDEPPPVVETDGRSHRRGDLLRPRVPRGHPPPRPRRRRADRRADELAARRSTRRRATTRGRHRHGRGACQPGGDRLLRPGRHRTRPTLDRGFDDRRRRRLAARRGRRRARVRRPPTSTSRARATSGLPSATTPSTDRRPELYGRSCVERA